MLLRASLLLVVLAAAATTIHPVHAQDAALGTTVVSVASFNAAAPAAASTGTDAGAAAASTDATADSTAETSPEDAAANDAAAAAPKEAVTLLCLTNRERAKHGLPNLGFDANLEACAQSHSQDMAYANSLSHTGLDGSSPDQRIRSYGYQGVTSAENVAMGSWDLQEVMNMWLASPGHYANIMDPAMTHFGCGMAEGGSNVYFTQAFGGDGRSHNFPECPDLSKPAAKSDAAEAAPAAAALTVWQKAADSTAATYYN